jgi:flagellar motility protein MotE (MotC chaperone)
VARAASASGSLRSDKLSPPCHTSDVAMKKSPQCVSLAMALALGACGDPTPSEEPTKVTPAETQIEISRHEQIADQFLDSANDLADTLREVSDDVESAKAGASKLAKITNRFDTLQEEISKLDSPTTELSMKIDERMEQRLEEIQEILDEEVGTKEFSQEAGGIIMPALVDTVSKMEETIGVFAKHFGGG